MNNTLRIATPTLLGITILSVFIALSESAASAGTPDNTAPYERYGHIERFAIDSVATGKTYTIGIRYPDGYATTSLSYPSLFVLDGDYSFDAVVALSSYMQRGEIEQHIIIGISNDVPFGAKLGAKRTPDFTPPTEEGVITRNTATPYYHFLRDELIPEIERRVRINPDQRTVWGYSLSGSFITWLNYYDRSLFQNYIIASANWGQFGIQQRLAEGVVFNSPESGLRKLFLSFDLSEIKGIPNPDGTFQSFVDAGPPGYKTDYILTDGESHATSWFVTLPAALRFIYGRK